ncbi:recombinase zinc beta ribbon domain-containing protein [Rhodococcoides corynebacterioides]|uniref:Recombinase zinc beta ribbon domain-containing protein n=1 Tax=Rhodococcoides corynebacterioides TaxID=53972 RepID=A0ABS7P6E0_9NOCA|nr:recombinase zinc beta ribbon domain-containing protein [Rhodococcus corynebacterioides]MBY6367997.1 recombinase zinc beta ribbon domain-containing protein [Rhodococcus corynebacterioides]MBY6409551.1 recombinase zinc beta ribbon domain-containing protein [Rhodococcus corynebacterioides]
MTLTTLTDLLRDRGLVQRATPKQPERPLQRSNVHRLLINSFYTGKVTWRGVEHPGTHEVLVDEETFKRVQDKLTSRRANGNRERKHHHYLSGSLYCGRCYSRLLYMVTTGRRGGRYEYYACSGRHTKSTDCQAPLLRLNKVEQAISRSGTASTNRGTPGRYPQCESASTATSPHFAARRQPTHRT